MEITLSALLVTTVFIGNFLNLCKVVQNSERVKYSDISLFRLQTCNRKKTYKYHLLRDKYIVYHTVLDRNTNPIPGPYYNTGPFFNPKFKSLEKNAHTASKCLPQLS
jgi:hypothetical protein